MSREYVHSYTHGIAYEDDGDLEARLAEWERFKNVARPHGCLANSVKRQWQECAALDTFLSVTPAEGG